MIELPDGDTDLLNDEHFISLKKLIDEPAFTDHGKLLKHISDLDIRLIRYYAAVSARSIEIREKANAYLHRATTEMSRPARTGFGRSLRQADEKGSRLSLVQPVLNKLSALNRKNIHRAAGTLYPELMYVLKKLISASIAFGLAFFMDRYSFILEGFIPLTTSHLLLLFGFFVLDRFLTGPVIDHISSAIVSKHAVASFYALDKKRRQLLKEIRELNASVSEEFISKVLN